MAVLGVTPAEVYSALEAGNLQGTPGKLKMLKKYIDLDSQTTLHTAQEFDNLVVKKVGLIFPRFQGHMFLIIKQPFLLV